MIKYSWIHYISECLRVPCGTARGSWIAALPVGVPSAQEDGMGHEQTFVSCCLRLSIPALVEVSPDYSGYRGAWSHYDPPKRSDLLGEPKNAMDP